MTDRICSNCAHQAAPVSIYPCSACNQGAVGVFASHWAPIVAPVPAPTGIEAEVCADIARRQALGVIKYGQTVAENPLTHEQWLQHAYEEALDLAVYLKRAMTK